MHRRLGRSAAGVAAGLVLAVVATSPVAAECQPRPAEGDRVERVFVFTATVRSVETETDNPPTGDEDTVLWQLALDVDRIYRGEVRDPLLLRGSTSEGGIGHGCGYFLGDRVTDGDVLFVALDEAIPFETNDSLFGNLLLWRQPDGGWEFYEAALQEGDDPAAYPKAAREATSLAEILAVVDRLAMPETATEPASQGPGAPRDPYTGLLLSILGLAALLVGLGRRPLAKDADRY